MSSRSCGEMNAYFYIEITDGSPITFSCRAKFRGPTVKVAEPIVDFGLVKANTAPKYRIVIENLSPVYSEILVKSIRNKELSLATIESHKYLNKFRETRTLKGNSLKI